MTTIAWDGKTLAGDRKSLWDGTPASVTKIHCIKGNLLGFAGSAYIANSWIAWMKGIGAEPKNEDDNGIIQVILIDRLGYCWAANGRKIWDQVTLPYWAIGSGADYALGAMECGRSAADAVRVACKLDNNSGLGIDTLVWVQK